MELKVGDEVLIINNMARHGQTMKVTEIKNTEVYGIVYILGDVKSWFQSHEIRRLTKLERALK